MAITINDHRIISDLAEDYATLNHDGRWIITGPIFDSLKNLGNGYIRNQAITALTLAEHLTLWGTEDNCAFVQIWHEELTTHPTPHNRYDQSPAIATTETPPHVSCLYCGSYEIFETLVTIDERQTEYALQCYECHGVWAAQ